LGLLGFFIALIRSSFPISFLIGFYKSLIYSEPLFLIFKIVYDFGLFVGIIEYLFGREVK